MELHHLRRRSKPFSAEEQRKFDLANLAIDRTAQAILSVTQLLNSEDEVYSVFLAVAATLVETAADVIQHNLKEHGRAITDADATKEAIYDLMAALEIAPPRRSK